MCGIIPMAAAGKVSPGASAALGGVAGLALHESMKKKKKAATASEAFYGANTSG